MLVWPTAGPPSSLIQQAAELQHRAIQDTVAAVFRQSEYDRGLGQTLWDWLLTYFWRAVSALFRALGQSPAAGRAIEIAIVAILVLILVRAIIAVVAGDIVFGEIGGLRTSAATIADHWAEAQRLSAAGQYTEAAHELYAALLASIARREEVHLHPSKTVGDYVRDLRRRSSALLPRFRDFARSYEVVVYGLGLCDRERYERLYSLAAGMVQPRAP